MASRWMPVEDGHNNDYTSDNGLWHRITVTNNVIRTNSWGYPCPDNVRLCQLQEGPPLVEMTKPRVAALQELRNLGDAYLALQAGNVAPSKEEGNKRVRDACNIVRQMLEEATDGTNGTD